MRKTILEALKRSILVIDGAMGTLLMSKGIPAGTCMEEANVLYPEIVKEVHVAYIKAGADIIETNTFGGSPLKLVDYGLQARAYELNKAAVLLARAAAGNKHYVAASMGPCGKLLEPLGKVTFEQAYESFAIQAKAFEDGGADIVCIETMGDLLEIKAAVLAVKENTSLPVICSLTYDAGLRTMTGTDPYVAFVTLAAMGVEVIGTNCSMGPDGMLEVLAVYQQARTENGLNTYIMVMPNAGLPEMVDGKPVHKLAPDKFCGFAPKFVGLGASIIGGCCGTTPEHIRQVKKSLKKASRPVIKTKYAGITTLTSRSRKVTVSPAHMPLVIGERLNPTARKILAEDLIKNGTENYRKEAREQAQAGADLLDVNTGYPEVDQVAAMSRIVQMLAQNYDVPLCLDSSDPAVLEAGLRAYPGKALINSVNGEEKSLHTILPLARKYGAAVIGLTLDEKGIPPKAEKRLKIAEKIVKRAQAYGISKNDIFIDTLVLAASAEQDHVMETIKAVTLVKEKLGVKTSLGLSNVSHGLPKRKLLNHTFMAMALGAGLDALIANPLDPFVRSLIAASAVLTGRDKNSAGYIAVNETLLVAEAGGQVTAVSSKQEAVVLKNQDKPLLNILSRKIIEGDQEGVSSAVAQALKEYKPQEIIEQGLLVGMDYVGVQFKAMRFFLPQVMASAEAMKKAFAHLKPFIKKGDVKSKGKVIIATVKGDIHDIGKNMVALMLENSGFEVIDIGKNVESDEIVRAAREHKPALVCLSALLTTTMQEMEVVANKLKAAGIKTEVMVGGAVVTAGYAKRIGAHYAADAIGAVNAANMAI